MEFTVAVFKDQKSKWYIGQCVEVRGAFSQGRSLEELLSNMKEAISLVVDYRKEEIEKDLDWKNIFYRKVEIKFNFVTYLSRLPTSAELYCGLEGDSFFMLNLFYKS